MTGRLALTYIHYCFGVLFSCSVGSNSVYIQLIHFAVQYNIVKATIVQ